MSTRRRTASGALPVAAPRYALPARRAGGGGARRGGARASPLAAGETRALHDLAEASAFRAGKVVGGPFTSSNRVDPRPIEFRPMSESLDAAIPGGSASGPNPRPMARATCRGSANSRGHPDAFDLFMAGIGVCAAGDFALPVLMRVIGHRTARGWIPADGGWIPAPGVGPITAMAVVAAFDAEPRGCGTGPGRLPRDAERVRPRRRGNRPSPRTPGGAPEHPCAWARDGAEPETDPTRIFSEPGGTARVSSRARPRQ